MEEVEIKTQIFILVCLLLFIPCQARIIIVDANGTVDFNNIQAAINDSNDGDVIRVQPGTYYENVNFHDKVITLTSASPNDPNTVAKTIIDGNGTDSVVIFDGNETSECVLSGFTLTNGDGARGGGIYGGEPFKPGKIGTRATIRYNIILNNSAKSGGGIANCDGLIQHNIVTQNTASGAGGGIWHSDGLIQNNTVSYNISGHQGGGLCGCFGTIRNNLIFGNSTGDWGGGINKSLSSDGIIENNTIYGNSADYGGGLCDCGKVTIRNCIVWGNTAYKDGDQFYDHNAPYADPCFSCIQDWPAGTGNIHADPCFFAPTAGDYHLQSEAGRWDPNQSDWVYDANTSPCIDSGALVSNWTAELWPHGKWINMGAFGGTPQASMSLSDEGNVADLNIDDTVNFLDFAHYADSWQIEAVLLFEDLDRNGFVDFGDFAIFAENWLWEQ